MPLREIIRWSYARERARGDAERKAREARESASAAGADGDAAPAPAPAPAPPAPGTGGRPPLAPQVELVGGRIVVAQASLTVQAQPAAAFTRVVEDVPVLNAATHAARLPNTRWPARDTELFFCALAQFGTDFSLMERVFPGRARRALKNKFNRECRAAPERVDAALRAAATGEGAVASYRGIIALLAGDAPGSAAVRALDGLPAPAPAPGGGRVGRPGSAAAAPATPAAGAKKAARDEQRAAMRAAAAALRAAKEAGEAAPAEEAVAAPAPPAPTPAPSPAPKRSRRKPTVK